MSLRLIALVLASFLLIVGALKLAGVAPSDAFLTLLHGSFGSPRNVAGTLRETTPLLIAGVAVFLALRAGLFNIGVEGQFLVGAMMGAWAGLAIGGPVGMVAALVVGAVAGALWAFPAGWIRAYRGGHEVISTIMLNWVALLLTRWAVAGPLQDPGQQSPQTKILDPSTRLPMIGIGPGAEVNVAIGIGILATVCLVWWLRRTVAGYELTATGANPTAARFAGVRVPGVTVRAMLASGGLSGLAGSAHVLAYEGRFYQGFSPGYGFDALGVALLAGSSPWGLLPASLLFGALNQGSTRLGVMGVPKAITVLLLGLLIIAFAAYRYRKARQGESP
jgi:simple sugar transport system permease protein